MFVICDPSKSFVSDTLQMVTTPVHSLFSVLERLYEFGINVNKTRELTNVLLSYDILFLRPIKVPASKSFIAQNMDVIRFCDNETSILFDAGENFGFDYKGKIMDEVNHYRYLEYGLIHKMEEAKFFFNQNSSSRKIVLSSSDCISNLQFITRGRKAYLNVMMRSSDVIKLFPLDIINLLRMGSKCMEFTRHYYEMFTMNVFVTSLHVYDEDLLLATEAMDLLGSPDFLQRYDAAHDSS